MGDLQQFTRDDLLFFALSNDLSIALNIDRRITLAALILAILLLIIRLIAKRGWRRHFEVDQAQFGLGNQKLILKPNEVDRQIAYKIWVELSTRKIGLPIDAEHDVIVEVYDSWYNFFSVTRELIKDVPVSKFRRKDTEKIIRLSIEVLNTGLRPHLTKWQARFRRWYDKTLDAAGADLSPQDIQKQFPQFSELRDELAAVNERLIKYREKMYELVTNL